jgi:type IV pilus assembly protein PilY1
MNIKHPVAIAVAALALTVSGGAWAQSIFTEDFTGATTSNSWYFFNGACLTAGSSTGAVSPGPVPSCMSIKNSYYSAAKDGDPALVGGSAGVSGNSQTLPDPVGKGALRFTNGSPYGHSENGAIVSAASFNAGQGIQITFKTVTYRGDSGGAGKDGADGMSFYLLDGSVSPSSALWNGIGSWGGSLGYTCSNKNPPYDGLIAAYLGLGIDEFGNFLNGQTLAAGYTGSNTATGDNTAYGYGYKPNRIGLRGAGNVSWAYLNTTYPAYYTTSTLNTPALKLAAVKNTCLTGQVWDYSASATSPTAVSNPSPALQDYAPIAGAYYELPSTTEIANESANARPDGVTVQNVFLYSLQITQNGLLSFSYSMNGGTYTPVITSQSITASNGALPATLRFGFAGSTGGDTNIHEILCFKAAPTTVSASSATVNEKQTSQVQTTSQAYFAFYNPNDWTGRVTAFGLVDTNGVVTIQGLANWDSECVLTGVPSGQTCLYTGSTGPATAEAISGSPGTARQMMTWSSMDTTVVTGATGIPFQYASMSAAEQTAMGGATSGTTRVAYLRGDRSNEINSAGVGLYRARDGVLGDIIDASPTWVGPPASPYAVNWADRYDATGDTIIENSGQTYQQFLTANQSRLNVIYAGANDGFLHGFRTGSEDINGNVINTSSTPNDGGEIIAYMPGTVLNVIHNTSTPNIDYSNPQYSHAFYVDATPGTGDVYYSGAWHTILVGGLGVGGNGLYALDITNPSYFNETNASSIVLGDWSSATISCVGNSGCGTSLGNTFGTPQIRRFHNGTWGAVFGNGYGSSTGDAGIYVMTISGTSPLTFSFYYLSTGTSGTNNGIAHVSPADLDGDHITDYVYAGDLNGNVWRFDLTSTNPATWAVTKNGGTPAPVFKTPSGQPITTQLVLASAVVSGSLPAVIVAFGTGQHNQFTTTSAASYATNTTQSLYGVWDWNFATWNAKSTAAQYSSLTTTQANAAAWKITAAKPVSQSLLTAQTYTVNTGTTTTITTSNNAITWAQCAGASTSTCTGQFGWYANLPQTNGTTAAGASIVEQVVSNPSLFEDGLIVNSTIPANNQPLNCNSPTTDQGVTYVVALVSGGTFASGGASPGTGTTTFNSAFVNYRDTNTAGIQTNETGALTVVNTREGSTYLIGQDISIPTAGNAPGGAQQIALSDTTVNRLTWIQLR